MVTPTLFDVATITRLRPTGEAFNLYVQFENTINFKVNHAGFAKYIEYYHTKGSEVSDVEHITFLALWLSRCIFCSKSLQASKRFLTLVNQLHSGRNVCLSKLILAGLYEFLG